MQQDAIALPKQRMTRLAPAAFAAAAVTGLAWFDGGFFPPAWSIATLGMLGVIGIVLMISDDITLSRSIIIVSGSYTGFALWTLASAIWSVDATKSVYDGQLAALYAVTIVAAIMVTARQSVAWLLNGTLAAMVAVCAYSLAGRLAPNVVGYPSSTEGFDRLYSPIGYWNGLGGFAAIAMVLGAGLALTGRTVPGRVVAGASLTITAPTLYLTFSRGALIALAAGSVAMLVLSPQRLRVLGVLAAVGPVVLVEILLIRSKPELTALHLERRDVIHAGNQVLLPIAGLMVLAIAMLTVGELINAKWTLPTSWRRVMNISLLVGLIALAGIVVIARGGPIHAADSLESKFSARPPQHRVLNNADRLTELSLAGRIDEWRVAWRLFEHHPVIGYGAGTWEYAWLQNAPYPQFSARAHSLYLETLSELGIIGGGLLALALLAPVGTAIRLRRDPQATSAAAAAVVFLVHSGVDWDWQLPAVTVPFLLCVTAVLRRDAAAQWTRELGALGRWLPAAGLTALVILAAVALQGNRLTSNAADAIEARNSSEAISRANAARRWMPWSYEPLLLRGEAQLQAGDKAAAERSLMRGLTYSNRNWRLWLYLAKASSGATRRTAVLTLHRLYPLDSDLYALCSAMPRSPCDFPLVKPRVPPKPA